MLAYSLPSGATKMPNDGPLRTVIVPVQSAATVYTKGKTPFSKGMLLPIRTVTVAVPVPSPLKILTPASPAGVGPATPNAGGRSTPDSANKYRPCNVARVQA